MARRSDLLASRVPLGGVENQPWESNFNSPRAPVHSTRVPTSQPAPGLSRLVHPAAAAPEPHKSLHLSSSPSAAALTLRRCLLRRSARGAGPPDARGPAAGGGAGGGGGACSPRAVPAPSGASQAPARPLPTAAFGRRMLPGSECYTYTFHSRHDSADLIHPRSPRCHWPGVTSGGGGASAAPIHNPRPAARGRLGAGSAGGARGAACAGTSGASSAAGGRPRASPSESPGLVPGLGLRLLPPGSSAAQRRWPGNRGPAGVPRAALPRPPRPPSAPRRERLPEPAAGSVRVPGEDAWKWSTGASPRGGGGKQGFIERDQRLERLSPPTFDPPSEARYSYFLLSIETDPLFPTWPMRPFSFPQGETPRIKRKYYNQGDWSHYSVSTERGHLF